MSETRYQVICEGGQVVAVTDHEQAETARFHAIWLRDKAPDADTRSPSNGQRLIAIADIPQDIAVGSARVDDSNLIVDFMPEARSVAFDLAWLFANRYDTAPPTCQRGDVDDQTLLWDSGLGDDLPQADFSAVMSDDAALYRWLGDVVRFGFAFLSDGPVEDGALFRIIDRFGYVRETNYGRHFEVRSQVNPTNLAYTGLGLQAHTDNPYRDPSPTLQILYCLESSASGGDNMVVDGFAAAQRLRDENTDMFDVLADHCARFTYEGSADVSLTARRPLIQLAPDGQLVGVSFNNRSAAATTDVPFDKMPLFYQAIRRFAGIIDDPSMEVAFRLNPGDSFIVDNTRVLHARKAFSGSGSRWLQGAYADRDSLQSRHRVLARQFA